jgi:hypothetical protein
MLRNNPLFSPNFNFLLSSHSLSRISHHPKYLLSKCFSKARILQKCLWHQGTNVTQDLCLAQAVSTHIWGSLLCDAWLYHGFWSRPQGLEPDFCSFMLSPNNQLEQHRIASTTWDGLRASCTIDLAMTLCSLEIKGSWRWSRTDSMTNVCPERPC